MNEVEKQNAFKEYKGNPKNVLKIQMMFEMQDSFNSRVNPKWREAGYAWHDAIWTECAEALNHTNWEWWKNQNNGIDTRQLKMEVVDIWHFVMSQLLECPDYAHPEFMEGVDKFYYGMQLTRPPTVDNGLSVIRAGIRNVAVSAIENIRKDNPRRILASFVALLQVCEMDWDELYKLYVSKNTLNQFRQDNDYKTKTSWYKDTWKAGTGGEDNEFLYSQLEKLDVNSMTFQADIYSALKTKFEEIKAKE